MPERRPPTTQSPTPAHPMDYRGPEAAVGSDEIIEGEPRHAFMIQLCLIAALIVAMAVMAIVNRFVG